MGKILIIKGANFSANAIGKATSVEYIGLPNGMTIDDWKNSISSALHIPAGSSQNNCRTAWGSSGLVGVVNGCVCKSENGCSIYLVNSSTNQAQFIKEIPSSNDWTSVRFNTAISIDSNKFLVMKPNCKTASSEVYYNTDASINIGTPKQVTWSSYPDETTSSVTISNASQLSFILFREVIS